MGEQVKAPAGLGAAGRRLWRQVTSGWELDSDELAVLEQAARTVDELGRLEEALADSGTWTVGSTGQQRVNPLYAEVRAHRETVRKLLDTIRVPAKHDSATAGTEWARWANERRWKGRKRGA